MILGISEGMKMEIIKNEECYVAFIDILGFKQYVKNKEPDKVLELFEEILKNKDRIGKDKIAICVDKQLMERYNLLSEKIYMYVMSDSIILAIKSCHEGGLKFLAKWCMNIQFKLLFKYHIMVRGGISKGIYYGDGIINFGKGMISAVELESSAVYPRIIVDSNLVEEIERNSKLPFLNHEVTIAADVDGKYYIDYLTNINWKKVQKDIMEFIKSGKDIPLIKEKYDWLENKVKEKIEEYEEILYQHECAEEFLLQERNQDEINNNSKLELVIKAVKKN